MEFDREYHIQFSRLTENEYLVSMMEDIRDIMHLMGLQALGIKGRMQDVIHEHEKISNAIVKGNIGKAKEYMKYHLDTSRDAVKQVYQDKTEQAC